MNRSLLSHCLAVVMAAGLLSAPARAGWQDMLKGVLGGDEDQGQDAARDAPAATATETAAMPDAQTMTRGVLEALQVGVQRAIATLGQEGGYLRDEQVRIPMPQELRTAESVLRRLGQDRYADEFIQSMNRAAEQAVPQTREIFIDTIKGLSVSDARDIVQGEPDAATQYFREHSSDRLSSVIRPIVAENMDRVGVTSRYKQLVSRAGIMDSFMNRDSLDLDAYVTDRTLDGLFLKLAEEEQKIREQPAARTTELLKGVFGYFDR
ncbi:DUF4197 domain-containing protein [Thiohalobacter thiocyanaticus]|uniref:DUF4197 domain-containing protein n=1 Tax=Thiohalobacter thiocyanaticus TaxID=585455 RepID=A0A426QE86_9GAMM|nr:DUF4197 domain-containing protein [Thiohalobacter thiocyanaticus]RRQ20082.1 DUF4197 domain-containing protein [Thiohalobacter thiocyanaticus]